MKRHFKLMVLLAGLVYITNPVGDKERVKFDWCASEEGRLTKLGGFYLCDVGPDPYNGRGAK